MNRDEALKVSDAFISAMQADRADEALDMMEPEFVRTAGRNRAAEVTRHVFDYCGHPARVRLKRDEVGVALYADGHAKPMRRFFYAAITTDANSYCTLTVEVVPNESAMKVGKFGSLKPQ